MKCCINDVNYIRLLFLLTELFEFEFQKCGQILCAHKPYFLMLGHILGTLVYKYNEYYHRYVRSIINLWYFHA